MAVNPKMKYFDEFRDLYCDGSAEQFILAALVDAGYSDRMEYAPSDPDFVDTMIRDGGKVEDFYFKHWIELHDEIWDNISTHVGDKPFLKRYICSMIQAFKEVSAYYYPGEDASDNEKSIAHYLEALANYNLPRTKELNEVAAPVAATLKSDPTFASLSDEEKNKRFLPLINKALEQYKERLKLNIYEVSRLLHGMMEELAVHITACLLESGEKSNIFDYQKMCGVLLTDAIYPFYLCRTMDWTKQFAESYLPEPMFYYPDSIKAKLHSKPSRDGVEPLNGAVKCGVREIDEFLEAGRKKVAEYDEEKVERDLKTFRALCIEKAKGTESREAKTAWIVEILTILTEVYYYNVNTEYAQYSYAARRFMIVMEAAFLRCADKICVKDLYMELSMEGIIDFPYTSDPEAVVVPEPDPFNPHTTWGEHLLREEVGSTLKYHEKQRCSKCEKMACRYRFGQVDFAKSLEAAGIDASDDIPFPLDPHRPPRAAKGEKEYETLTVTIDGEEEELDSLNYVELCGVKEIDRLLVLDIEDNPKYTDEDFYIDSASFRHKCKALADSDIPVAKKEQWIARVLNVLQECFCNFDVPEKKDKVKYVIGLTAVLDAVFMKALGEVCVRRIAQEGDTMLIFDELPPEKNKEGEKNRIEMGLDECPWEEDFLFEELTTMLVFHERRMCRDCLTEGCKYRFGLKHYFGDVDYNFGISLPEEPVDEIDDEKENDTDTATTEVPLSTRMQEYLTKAAGYFQNGRWHNDERKEYAVFLKTLYCKVFFKDWKNNVRWSKLPISPLKDGTLLTIDQLKGAMKGYDEILDNGLRKTFEDLFIK